MTLLEEKEIRIESAELGAEHVLKRLGIVRDTISQREAYAQFGEAMVRSWVNRQLITPTKVGERNSKVSYSYSELRLLKKLTGNRKLR
ncbi:MAG: hypothetical protein H6Q17_531 [Bacteroidetes bacterium]|nr:hypothetical protein [Bacteroidota bacterium]